MSIRRIGLLVIPCLLVLSNCCLTGIAQEDDQKHADEIAWFDMDHCEICKNMASMKHEMHRVEWEMHMLDDGMLTVAKVPDDMKEEMAKAEEGVQKTVAKLTAGQQLQMCGYCQNYGKLMELGADFKEFKTVGVHITLITSDDAEVVKEIQAMGKKAKVEHDKMLKRAAAHSSGTK